MTAISPTFVDAPMPRVSAARTPAAVVPRVRLASLDVFRGLTVAGMLVVNDPGNPLMVYAPIVHSAWHGWTAADLVFPFFLFVVGITTHLSLAARAERGDDAGAIRRQVLRRAGVIFLLGLLLAWYPFYQAGDIPGHPSPHFGDRLVERLLRVRLLGVLQRTAVAYLVAALVAWKAPARRVATVTGALLLGYWLVLAVVPVPGTGATGAAALAEPSRTLAAWLDRAALDWTRWGLGNHLWSETRTWDPEGLLSTVPSVATVLLGVLAGRWLLDRRPLAERLTGLFAAGAVGMSAGLVWGWALPINKALWTSSYVLVTAGLACIALGTVTWLVDDRRWRGWAAPFVALGTNPIVAYVGSELLARVLHSSLKVHAAGRWMPFERWVYGNLVLTGFEPRAASLLWALAFVAVWCAILGRLHRRGIVVRV